MEQHNQDDRAQVVILHGFTKEQIFAVMRTVKRELGPAMVPQQTTEDSVV
jgi:hypothetical protein